MAGGSFQCTGSSIIVWYKIDQSSSGSLSSASLNLLIESEAIIQKTIVKKSSNQEVEMSRSQEIKKSRSQKVKQSRSQEVKKSSNQEVKKSNNQEVKKSSKQEVKFSRIQVMNWSWGQVLQDVTVPQLLVEGYRSQNLRPSVRPSVVVVSPKSYRKRL